MSLDFYSPVQFELFPRTVVDPQDKQKKYLQFKGLTLSPENTIVFYIVSLMLIILSFSLGIERGKRVVGMAPLSKEPLKISEKKVSEKENFFEIPEEIANTLPLDVKESLRAQQTISDAKTKVKTADKKQKSLTPPQEKIQDKNGGLRYTIQVASFKSKENAYQELEKLNKVGVETFVVPKGGYSIVCVGRFLEKDAALKIINKLKNRYKDCLIRRL